VRRMGTPGSVPRRAWPRQTGVLPVLLVLSVTGCSVMERWSGSSASSSASSSAPSPYGTGVLRLGEGDFAGAERAFRESASRCESGQEGRRALLFLSLLTQDPRNPEAQPDSAALMAARFLYLPNTIPDEDLEAEALYVAALDRGADPGLRPDPEGQELALRFDRCGEPLPPREERPLPVLDNPTSLLLHNLDLQRNALADQNEVMRQSRAADRRTLADQNEALRLTIEELQAELQRLRRLLRLPDTSTTRLPSGT